MSVPNIPPPPPRDGASQSRAKKGDRRWLAWLLALGLGVAVGALGHEWLPPVERIFDDMLAALL